jgi:hypothetical protein
MSADWAAKPEAVPYSSLSDPQTLNLYQYMRNNPLGGTDKDGHCGQQAAGQTTCPAVTVTATPATQPAPVHTTTVTARDGTVHSGTGPTAEIHFTVTADGKPAAGATVTETNKTTTVADGVVQAPGKQVENDAHTNNVGTFHDTVGPIQPPSAMTPADATTLYNSHAVTVTNTQTLTVTLPNGCTCTATDTRTTSNVAPGGGISPSGYTLTTTQPVVTTPKPPQQ